MFCSFNYALVEVALTWRSCNTTQELMRASPLLFALSIPIPHLLERTECHGQDYSNVQCVFLIRNKRFFQLISLELLLLLILSGLKKLCAHFIILTTLWNELWVPVAQLVCFKEKTFSEMSLSYFFMQQSLFLICSGVKDLFGMRLLTLMKIVFGFFKEFSEHFYYDGGNT